MFDVGEDFQNCDIGLCEGTGLGKGFSMMTRFVVEANFGFRSVDR